MKLNLFTYLLPIALLFTACKKDTKTILQPKYGTVNITLENVVGSEPLILNTKNYITLSNDTFKLTTLKYYISNIKLIKNDGSIFVEENSYHLINQAKQTSLNLTLINVPQGNYKAISYVIGVDSAKCCSGAQIGDLDPANGMFWDWDTGYIMGSLIGTSPQSTGQNNAIVFQTVGFTGANNVIKYANLNFNTTTANVNSEHSPTIYINCNVLEWFNLPNNIKFATTNFVAAPGTESKKIADNYEDMFTIKTINN